MLMKCVHVHREGYDAHIRSIILRQISYGWSDRSGHFIVLSVQFQHSISLFLVTCTTYPYPYCHPILPKLRPFPSILRSMFASYHQKEKKNTEPGASSTYSMPCHAMPYLYLNVIVCILQNLIASANEQSSDVPG